MVQKTRNKTVWRQGRINGIDGQIQTIFTSTESMIDSSITGSARTDIDPIDAFLAKGSDDPSRGRGAFQRALRSSYDIRGDAGIADFQVTRTVSKSTPVSGVAVGTISTTLENWCMSVPSSSSWPALTPYSTPSSAQMESAGQSLYNRALPNRDQADLGTALGEIALSPLRALSLPGAASAAVLHSARASSSQIRRVTKVAERAAERQKVYARSKEEARALCADYLAYIYGVRPTAKTLSDLADSYNRSRRSAEKIVHLGSLTKGEGRRIRRRRKNPTRKRVSSSIKTGSYRPGVGIQFSGWRLYAPQLFYHESTQDTWWSGSFRMNTFDTDSWVGKCENFFQQVDRLTGLGLDISAAWDLIPFSFMADWFANTGDFLENRQLIADYNIVCEYGYIMIHTRTIRELILNGTLQYQSYPDYYGKLSCGSHYQFMTETKKRARCKSFGFYTNFDNLNPMQWSALTAIGLSWGHGSPPSVRT